MTPCVLLGLSIVVSLLLATVLHGPEDDLTRGPEALLNSKSSRFCNDDIDTAYSFAAPGIKNMYPEPQRFIEMVKRNYQPVYRPRQLRFRPVAGRQRTATRLRWSCWSPDRRARTGGRFTS